MHITDKFKTIAGVSVFLFLYILATRAIFITMTFYSNQILALSIPTIIAITSAIVFLYIFVNEKRFRLAHLIKEKKMKTEQKLLEKFIQLGKFLTCITIGFIAGPLFAALTISILLPTFRYKYLFAGVIGGTSIFISLAVARGLVRLIL